MVSDGMDEAPHQQALNWAFRTFNERPKWRDSEVEVGCLLWLRRGRVKPGNLVVSKTSEEVKLYPQSQLAELLLNQSAYLGDFHAHPARANSLVAHFPSPQDITSQSALCDLWHLGGAYGDKLLAPKMQLIQSFLFGDIFLLLPSPERSVFTSMPAQGAEMARIQAEYDDWHVALHRSIGAQENIGHGAFVDLVRQELPRINAILEPRGILSFHPML